MQQTRHAAMSRDCYFSQPCLTAIGQYFGAPTYSVVQRQQHNKAFWYKEDIGDRLTRLTLSPKSIFTCLSLTFLSTK